MNPKTIALIAGQGAAPKLLAQAVPGLTVCEMDGFPCEIGGEEVIRFRFERLVPFLDELVGRGITHVVFAGALSRPKIEPEMFDLKTAQLVPRMLGAMQQGDDATLRAVIELFAEWDIQTLGIHELLPQLLPPAGLRLGAISERDEKDAARAAAIVAAMGAVDVGQGCVVSNGLCLAVEAQPGTDAMLDFVSLHKALNPGGGVFYKAPKPGQDRRIDLPVIGPQTVARVANAGLAGIVIEAGGVMVLDQAATADAATKAGIFLWVRP
ncbi:UDP-2,3-diacylglucosamine diphosphatase LpxI [Thioclava sp. GXIMD4216]|uniref:UDP-2,3-diacylglucosamine diphosphatase LpxI n=1 Tax=Thioclava litoralis TaxID=3076557 RepID=A0ABZ1DXV0_9RHOB|nr:UDP-2,3-diacylglucosamine diphosphatase LpxI [Thioclava sp. FTW29]